eukprot:3494194-Prorocentrum_lima.AAC.1
MTSSLVGSEMCIRDRNNSWVERANRTVLEGARCLLLQAGLPSRFWPYAVSYTHLTLPTI